METGATTEVGEVCIRRRHREAQVVPITNLERSAIISKEGKEEDCKWQRDITSCLDGLPFSVYRCADGIGQQFSSMFIKKWRKEDVFLSSLQSSPRPSARVVTSSRSTENTWHSGASLQDR